MKKTKDRVIVKASELIHRKGFRATTLDDILKFAKIKKGSLYYHFSFKEELCVEILQYLRKEFLCFLDDALRDDSSAEALLRFFEMVRKKHQQNQYLCGCIFGNTAIEIANENNDLRDITIKTFKEWIEKLSKIISNAQKEGKVRNDVTSDMLSKQVVMSIEGGIMLARLEKDGNNLDNCLDSLKKLIFL